MNNFSRDVEKKRKEYDELLLEYQELEKKMNKIKQDEKDEENKALQRRLKKIQDDQIENKNVASLEHMLEDMDKKQNPAKKPQKACGCDCIVF